jgi:anaerobic selenocysteine-containing dehydrogenase
MTDTAREAHLVLPTTTMLEEDDLVGSYGHHYLGNVRRVVAPPTGAKSDYEILQALAPRLGLGEEFGRSVREWKRRMLSGVADLGVTLESLERGAQRNPLVADVLYAERSFPTPSGKVNLIHEVDPDPPRPTPERPLLLMAIATEKGQASQMPARRQEGPASVTVHPQAANGFRAGDPVRVESDLGSLAVVLKLDERQRRDVALMDKGGWLHRGRCANALIRARLTDDGEGAAYYDTPVRLLPCE